MAFLQFPESTMIGDHNILIRDNGERVMVQKLPTESGPQWLDLDGQPITEEVE